MTNNAASTCLTAMVIHNLLLVNFFLLPLLATNGKPFTILIVRVVRCVERVWE